MAGAAEAPQAPARGRPATGWAARAARVPPLWIALTLASLALAARLAVGGSALQWHAGSPLGAALAAAGGAVLAWSAALFRAAGNRLSSMRAPAQLIEEGPYRYSRNPMALGTAALLAGAGLALGQPLLVVAALAYLSIVAQAHIPVEEARLLHHFGGWYRDYLGRTRRWL